jgi:hypothetical protein
VTVITISRFCWGAFKTLREVRALLPDNHPPEPWRAACSAGVGELKLKAKAFAEKMAAAAA